MVETNDDYLKRLGINMHNLEREMNSAVVKESRYWIENDAKIRAVQQGVPTYDDFKELVAGCHLKPLERSELINSSSKKSSWNYSATLVNNSTTSFEPKSNSSINTKTCTTPQEFLSHWRQIKSSPVLTDDNDRHSYLFELLFNQKDELMESLFHTGLGVSFLPDVLTILDHALIQADNVSSSSPPTSDDNNSYHIICQVFRILRNFQKSKQFPVAVDCLLDNEIKVAHQLLYRLKRIGNKFNIFEGKEEALRKLFHAFNCNDDEKDTY
uniref:Coiled-coil domain-containing protein 103 n=1 Tax=Trichobilharzia regenti TaxID=157069 RepID=A0AA85JUF5_TRIRE|nr:unnamed protein product [Trichobilharzia regenti]